MPPSTLNLQELFLLHSSIYRHSFFSNFQPSRAIHISIFNPQGQFILQSSTFKGCSSLKWIKKIIKHDFWNEDKKFAHFVKKFFILILVTHFPKTFLLFTFLLPRKENWAKLSKTEQNWAKHCVENFAEKAEEQPIPLF